MTLEEVKTLIDKKIGEHKIEIDGATLENESLQPKRDIEVAMKKMVLKDKILFHKAAIGVLQDLKNEL